uniref:Transposase (Putative), gypsy type n=1 Tax=Tanacetum cinerariifolium TaxID=118510 RepID=A0A6L2NF36_TANCI|nr:hypothetical protein [Tanacetum cinerariifolium]
MSLFRVFYTPSFNSGWMSFSKRPGKNTPQCYTKPLDSLKNWNNRFFWVDERVFPTFVDWRTNASKDGMPAEGTYSIEAVKTGSRPRAPHEVPLLTLTATRVIEMDDPAAATDSSVVPSTIERSPLDFALEAGASDQGTVAPEMPPSEDVPATDVPGAGQAEETAATDPPAAPESRKRGRDVTDVNAPPKSLRRDHADPRPSGSSREGKSLVAIQLGLASTVFVPEDASAGVSDPDPLSVADPPSRHPADVAQSSRGTAAAGDPEFKNAYSPFEVGSPESIYRPEWGVVNGSLLDTPEACQDLVDHVTPPSYVSELRHLHNDEFLGQYNVNLARQVAMGSQLRLRFEQEAKLLRKSIAQVARQDKRIQARELEIKNMKALLEAETNTKKAAEDRSAGLSQELENMRAQFSDLQVSNERLSQQVATLQQQRCAKMDARLDALSIDFDEELYPHRLTAIAGHRWVIGPGLRLAVMKYGESLELRQAFADVVSAGIAKGLSEGLRHGLEHGQAQLSLEFIEAYDPRGGSQICCGSAGIKGLESDSRDDAPQDIRDLRPSSSQLTIPVYPEVREPWNPWACKKEMVLADAIAANISRAEKKKKCRIVDVLYAPWESLLMPNILGIALRTQSPRPPGLQPVYAACHVQRYTACNYSGITTEEK